MEEQRKKYRIGVICAAPSAQMSGQYDALACLEDYEFVLLFKYSQSANAAWSKVEPKNHKWEVLPACPSWVPGRFKKIVNGDIRPVLDKYDFDALILHGIYDCTAVLQGQKWCRRRGRPYILRTDANVFKEQKQSGFWRNLRIKLLMSDRVKNAGAIVYIGTNNRRYYELFGAVDSQLFHAPWEIDYDVLDSMLPEIQARRGEIRKSIGLDDDTVAIANIGRLEWRKGHDYIIPAMAELARRGKKIRMLIAGDGEERPTVEKLISQNDAPVTMLGNCNRQQVMELLAASDIFLLGSVMEAWGLVVNEAAMASLPLVLSDCVGSGVDMVTPRNGFIFKTSDVADLVEKLTVLIDDAELRKSMGQTSREIITNWRAQYKAVEGYRHAIERALRGAEKIGR